jgi:hypothetical protein
LRAPKIRNLLNLERDGQRCRRGGDLQLAAHRGEHDVGKLASLLLGPSRCNAHDDRDEAIRGILVGDQVDVAGFGARPDAESALEQTRRQRRLVNGFHEGTDVDPILDVPGILYGDLGHAIPLNLWDARRSRNACSACHDGAHPDISRTMP